MRARQPVVRSAIPIAAAIACALSVLASPIVHADIYTWVDAAGSLNVSNVAPPEGVTISKVVPDSPPRPVPPPGVEADARRQAQVQMLAERVQQLERQVATAPQPTVMYAPPPVNVPPQIQYSEAPPAYTQNASCDPGWTDCGTWPNGIAGAPPYAYYPPYYYPASVIVVRNAPYRRYDPPGRNMPPRYGWQGGNRSPMPMPVPSPRPSPSIASMRTR